MAVVDVVGVAVVAVAVDVDVNDAAEWLEREAVTQ